MGYLYYKRLSLHGNRSHFPPLGVPIAFGVVSIELWSSPIYAHAGIFPPQRVRSVLGKDSVKEACRCSSGGCFTSPALGNDKAAPAPSKSRTSAGTSCKHFDVICIPSPANETPLTLCKQQKMQHIRLSVSIRHPKRNMRRPPEPSLVCMCLHYKPRVPEVLHQL